MPRLLATEQVCEQPRDYTPPPLEQIIDALNLGLVVLDRDLRMVLFNRWMAEQTRMEKESVLGRHILELFPELEQKGFAWKAENVFKLGNFSFFSQRLHRFLLAMPAPQFLQNRFTHMQQNAVLAPLRGDGGEVGYLCLTIQDITDAVTFQDRLEQTTKRLEQMSQTDHLTQVANRRHLFDRLSQEMSRTCRIGQPLAVAILDLDHFKSVNDRYGHLCGDQVLVRVASLLKEHLRPYDLVGRYGGEEFCLVLPNTGNEEAAGLLNRLRQALDQTEIAHEDARLRVTFSAGVASTECQPHIIADQILSQADEALYRAKSGGRNRVEISLPREKS